MRMVKLFISGTWDPRGATGPARWAMGPTTPRPHYFTIGKHLKQLGSCKVLLPVENH